MKEYLTKMKDGSYKLIPSKMGNDDIEIPEGANYAYNNDQGLCFLSGSLGDNHPLLIWQRAQHPEELPFVDDEPSINDQYAEIEQVRQSAYNTQIGGSHYKNLAIQPMEYALKNKLDYAQANVVKYVTRHALKGGKEDLLKAIHNIELMIAHYYGE